MGKGVALRHGITDVRGPASALPHPVTYRLLPLRLSRGVTRAVFGTGRRAALMLVRRGGMPPAASSRTLQ
jgi:hypothetical protein